MFEKVNSRHPDKIADRIAGAIVDLAYKKQQDPKIAVEVLIGHGVCHIIIESSVDSFASANKTTERVIGEIVDRIVERHIKLDLKIVPQDVELAKNQEKEIRTGDNGIFVGKPMTEEQRKLADITEILDDRFMSDGKYILADDELVICQSNATDNQIKEALGPDVKATKINPLGEWTGGTDVDTGCTNRKLGSDLADSITGGGIHGKDLSKADVSVTIYCWYLAQIAKTEIKAYCAIGDRYVNVNGIDVAYSDIVSFAKNFVFNHLHGFESMAEYGLVRSEY